MDTFSLGKIPQYEQIAKQGTVIAFDTETTGLDSTDEVVQLAVIVMRQGKVGIEKAVYLQNQKPIDGTEAQAVNKLTDAFLKENGLPPRSVLFDFLCLLRKEYVASNGNMVLIAHNLPFDLRMVNAMCKRYGLPNIPDEIIGCDTRMFVKSLNLPKHILPGNHLRNCITAFGLNAQNSHDALDDTRACLELFKYLVA